MSISEKLQTIAENEQKVYNAGRDLGFTEGHEIGYNDAYDAAYEYGRLDGMEIGREAEYDAFWDAYTDNGTRTDWTYAFATGWKAEIFKPNHKIKVVTGTGMFHKNNNITDFADFLGETEIDWSEAATVQYMFQNCSNLTRINVCGGGYFSYAFYASTKLHTIDRFILTDTNNYGFNEAFSHCTSLAYINEIVGTIKANVDFHYCPLVHDSLMNILNALYDYSGSGKTYTLTLGTKNLPKLTDAEKAIATQKGWTLA